MGNKFILTKWTFPFLSNWTFHTNLSPNTVDDTLLELHVVALT